MTIELDDDIVLDMLVERLGFWNKSLDSKDKEAFEEMYKNRIDEGFYNYGKFDVMQIVDNDVVNWCSVIDIKDVSKETWKELKDHLYDDTDALSLEAQDDLGVSGHIEVVTRDRAIICS